MSREYRDDIPPAVTDGFREIEESLTATGRQEYFCPTSGGSFQWMARDYARRTPPTAGWTSALEGLVRAFERECSTVEAPEYLAAKRMLGLD